MYRIRLQIRQLPMLAMLMAFACLAVSCITESGECPESPVQPREDLFKLHFQICARMRENTRADNVYTEQDGTVAENILDIDDISYYIFDRNGGFLLALKPTATFTTVISEDYALYDVVAEIMKDQDETNYFRNNWSRQVDFYILALANHTPYHPTLPQLQIGDPMSDLFGNKQIVLNTLPDTENIMHPFDNGEDKTVRKHIPMAGLQYFSLSGSWFETQTGEAPIDLTILTGKSLNMLRSVAKLEVIDMINIKKGNVYNKDSDGRKIRITNVSIDGIMKNARLLPAENQWKRNSIFETQQVDAPSVTGSGDYLLPPSLEGTGQTGNEASDQETPFGLEFVYDEFETQKREDKCPVYSCYIWEYDNLKEIPAGQRPYLSVIVRNPIEDAEGNDLTETPQSATYRIRLNTDMSADATTAYPIESLLRNHIYRYEITGAASDLAVKWSVCPMDNAKTYITFN